MVYHVPTDAKYRPLSDLVAELPPDVQAVVREFVEFLLAKQQGATTGKLRQDWAGALRDYREQVTSLDLQQQNMDWRSES